VVVWKRRGGGAKEIRDMEDFKFVFKILLFFGKER
jgi:hypothetical protein